MTSGNQNDGQGPRKVIDISERLPNRNPMDKFKALKVRLDLEQAKVAIPVSLLSILTVVTLANSKLLDNPDVIETRQLASSSESELPRPSRGLASVHNGTTTGEDELVKQLSGKALNEIAAVGRAPTALEKLTIETLEGKYAVEMDESNKISEIRIADPTQQSPVAFDERFIEKNRSWMPVAFDRSVRITRQVTSSGQKQSFHLVNGLSMPVAKVDVELDTEGRLLGFKVVEMTAAAMK